MMNIFNPTVSGEKISIEIHFLISMPISTTTK
jgi:hypothetical protein